jgi:hypothetical protein
MVHEGGLMKEGLQRRQQGAPLFPSPRLGSRPLQNFDSAPPIVCEVLRSPGQPLDPRTRTVMQTGLGHDFGRVRVHTDARASESTRAVRALAYTIGADLVFREGHYQPDTMAGRQLLAHELTHAVQHGVAPPIEHASEDAQSQDAGGGFSRLRNAVSAATSEASLKAGELLISRQEAPAGDEFPVINAEFDANPGHPQRCCTCGTPPCLAHNGPPGPADDTAQNGMNLVAKILHTIASSSRALDYGFVQITHARRCFQFNPGDAWDTVLDRPPGSNDVFGACATCTVPQIRDGLPEIVFSDAPGFAMPNTIIGTPAFGNQLMQRANFHTWVIAREDNHPWQRISEPVHWHSVSWIRRDAAGNWELNPGQNEIGPGPAPMAAGCPA